MSSASNLYITTSATLRREFRALLRSTRVFVATGILTGVVALLCVSSYPFGGESTSTSGVHYARVIVKVQLFSLGLAVLTALPALAVLGIHQDNRSDMLEHLACTPLNPRIHYGSRAGE
jgi:exosortase/archaeosortase